VSRRKNATLQLCVALCRCPGPPRGGSRSAVQGDAGPVMYSEGVPPQILTVIIVSSYYLNYFIYVILELFIINYILIILYIIKL